MDIRVNPELAALLDQCTTEYDQVRVLDTALTANKRIKLKRHANSSATDDEVWASGVLFRDAALVGAFTFNNAEITSLGFTEDLTTCTAADLNTGKSLMRIEGGGHWVEGSVGLTGAGTVFTLSANPTATNSIALAGTFRIRANQLLPEGTPDTTNPTVTLASSNTNVTTAETITLTATPSDNVGVTKVEFFRNGIKIGEKTSAPWTQTDSLTQANYGSQSYTATAHDAAGLTGSSSPVTVVVTIQETGTTVAVGSTLTTVSFQNTSTSSQTNLPVTFGQAFKLGALPSASAAVDLKAPDNSLVTCQLDVKATHPDGSVRHAVLSAIIPALAASETKQYSIVRRAAPPAGTPAVPADFSGLNATATIVETGTDISGPIVGSTYTADAAALLAAGTYETWLSGPVVSEWCLRVPLKTSGGVEHPDLHARFNIRAYKGQAKAKIDYVIENTWAKPQASPTAGTVMWESVSITDKIYRVSLNAGATNVYTRATNGFHRTKLNNLNNGQLVYIYSNNSTGLANDSTVYTATITIDGVAIPISVTGSAAQTYGTLRTVINNQLGSAGSCVLDTDYQALKFVSNTTGASSRVVVSYGTLFPALDHVSAYRPIYGDEVTHFARTLWKKTFWWGTKPPVHVAHNKQYLMDTRAVPNYQSDLTGSTSTISSNLSLINANSDIGQNGISNAFMGATGYARGIGILPEWSAMYLVNQGVDAKETMLLQADLGGGWPMYVRDHTTDQPLDFEDYPYVSLVGTETDSHNSATGFREKLPARITTSTLWSNINSPDIAHHPDFFFLPYLVTGDKFYLDGLLMHQRYTALSLIPTWRQARKCLLSDNQVRGQGWAFRTLGHSTYVTPDAHPLKSDLLYQLDQNRIWYDVNYVSTSGQYYNQFGIIRHSGAIVYTKGGQANVGIAPWQNDFFASSIGRLLELGYNDFRGMFDFISKFAVGRLTNSPAYCWQDASVYAMRVRETSTSALYTTWAELYEKSAHPEIYATVCGSQAMADKYAQLDGVPALIGIMNGLPLEKHGYPANLQPAVAYAASYGAQGGSDAWLVFDNRAGKPDYNLGPQFAIVPRV